MMESKSELWDKLIALRDQISDAEQFIFDKEREMNEDCEHIILRLKKAMDNNGGKIMGNNKYYIVRGDRSGVFAGNIKSRNGQEVCMTNVRCLWYWDGAATLLQLARDGVTNPRDCKFTVLVDELEVLDAIEIIPCTRVAEQCIKAVAEWKR